MCFLWVLSCVCGEGSEGGQAYENKNECLLLLIISITTTQITQVHCNFHFIFTILESSSNSVVCLPAENSCRAIDCILLNRVTRVPLAEIASPLPFYFLERP